MPTTSYITDLEGLVHTATSWVSITDTDVLYYDGETYRNSLNANYLGDSMTSEGAATANITDHDDVYNATVPWPKQKTITYRHWLDGSGNVICALPLSMLPRQSSAVPFYAS